MCIGLLHTIYDNCTNEMEKRYKGFILILVRKRYRREKKFIIVIISIRNSDTRKRHISTCSSYIHTAYSALITNGFVGDSVYIAFILNITINSSRPVFVKVKNTKYMWMKYDIFFVHGFTTANFFGNLWTMKCNFINISFSLLFLAKWLILKFIFTFSAIQLPFQRTAMNFFYRKKKIGKERKLFFPWLYHKTFTYWEYVQCTAFSIEWISSIISVL